MESVMRPALKILVAAAIPLAFAGCHKTPQQEQNISIDDDLMNGGTQQGAQSNAEVETLPADESSTTPSNQLQNGSDNPDVNDIATGNSD
jgi:hypothetical protein